MKSRLLNFIKTNYQFFIRYVIVGASGTAIDVLGFTALLAYTPLNRYIAATITFVVAVVNNFTWNKFWTFKDKDTSKTAKQFITFLIISIIGLSLNLFFLWMFTAVFVSFLQTLDLPAWANAMSKLMASGMVLTYNFLANRFITFKDAADNGTH